MKSWENCGGVEDVGFIQSCYLLSEKEIVEKYKNKYKYFQSSSIDKKYISLALPSEHIEMRLQDMSYASDEYCKRVVFLNAIIRRKIQPKISLEHLIYCLLCDNMLYKFNLIHDEVIRLSRKAMSTDMRHYSAICKTPNKYKVNRQEAERRGLTPRQASNIIRGERTSTRIRELYDESKTDEENVNAFKSYGLTISTRTLKRWRMANGYGKYKTKK